MTEHHRKIIVDLITRMLSRREHAYQEVLHKLQQKDQHYSQCIPILDEFKLADIQSDTRYASMRVRSGAAKGQGPERIRRECQQWQVDSNAIESAMAENDIDWFELAKQVRVKKFGETLPADQKLKFKQIRFLQYRGFNAEQINYAFE